MDGPQQTPVKVALFGDAAEQPPSPNDVVRVSGVYPYRRKKRAADEDPEDVVPTSLGTRQKHSGGNHVMANFLIIASLSGKPFKPFLTFFYFFEAKAYFFPSFCESLLFTFFSGVFKIAPKMPFSELTFVNIPGWGPPDPHLWKGNPYILQTCCVWVGHVHHAIMSHTKNFREK